MVTGKKNILLPTNQANQANALQHNSSWLNLETQE